jgi:predicted TPR repeat methyltransferase
MTIVHEPDWRKAWADLKAGPLVEGRPPAYVHAAQMLAARGLRAEAAAALREALRCDPNFLPALRWLASLAQAEGATAAAAEYRQRVVALEVAPLNLGDEARQQAASFRQALAGDAPPPERVPAEYLAARFDAWAPAYEGDLRDRLHYRGPEILADVVARVCNPGAPTLDILDLGCGTGLLAPLVRPWARRLHGVDLSPKMLEQARRREVYDQLNAEDLLVTLKREEGCWDLILAADVFNYLGSLADVFLAAARALRPDGLFAFTVESHAEPGYRLCPTGRFVHSPDYLRAQADAAGLREICAESATLRHESERPVESQVLVLQVAK